MDPAVACCLLLTASAQPVNRGGATLRAQRKNVSRMVFALVLLAAAKVTFATSRCSPTRYLRGFTVRVKSLPLFGRSAS